ncbi:MAG: serine kinase [Candidatus Omnitrophica bacterium CG11_big_fil_rev_8_21_14_0_20_42_13]|uniref:Serine kinase n=1 Tax=Candidatus Ghiorseimicrobium undicola TaxID=1974746 RepID=A0A2H0LYH0_9BACT|nr:MAG: serine kinase [Candidatus Omnitrophica bacterium CG11_big_fil_rev_8_21_14_0_20_42_13]
MKLKDIISSLNLEARGKIDKSSADKLDKDITRGYVSDLLSDVMANSEEGDLWITLQTHPNIIAVASMKGLAGIVIINGRQPEEEMVRKAEEENIPILLSKLPAFELIGRLYKLGIVGLKGNA